MVVREHPFNQQQASYYAYLRRYKVSGNMEGRVRFDDFLRHEQALVENEFFMAGLREQGKARGGAMPSLIKQQRDLRALLLIEEEESRGEKVEKFVDRLTKKTTTAGGTTADVQGPTGAKPKDAGDGMVTV